MYNLLVSGSTDAWDGKPWLIEKSRCVHEYTDPDLQRAFGSLDKVSIERLLQLPSIFAYEKYCKKNPKFGRITEIAVRQGKVRIGYQIFRVSPFLKHSDLQESFDLDIGKLEMYRTHWAVKNVDLFKELKPRKIKLPKTFSSQQATRSIDIDTHKFKVALSFPGEVRKTIVEHVVNKLENDLGPDSYFYDENYKALLARPELDNLLQKIYLKNSRLVVVFHGGAYQRKKWCGLEWHAIRNLIHAKKGKRVMFIKLDDKPVDGIHPNDGYIDVAAHSPEEIGALICQRVANTMKSK